MPVIRPTPRATKMFDMVKHDPILFQKRYADLLRNGFYAPPAELLRKFFGKDLSQRELVDGSMSTLQAQIEALTEMYKRSDAKH
jgi:oligoendopeptidase F